MAPSQSRRQARQCAGGDGLKVGRRAPCTDRSTPAGRMSWAQSSPKARAWARLSQWPGFCCPGREIHHRPVSCRDGLSCGVEAFCRSWHIVIRGNRAPPSQHERAGVCSFLMTWFSREMRLTRAALAERKGLPGRSRSCWRPASSANAAMARLRPLHRRDDGRTTLAGALDSISHTAPADGGKPERRGGVPRPPAPECAASHRARPIGDRQGQDLQFGQQIKRGK